MENISLLELVRQGEISPTGQVPKLPTRLPNVNAVALEVYRIPLKYLYYNNENGRIASAGLQDISPARDDEDESYNKFYENAIVENNAAKLKRTKKSINEKGQEVFGYVLDDGRVIDGNRRYTSLRQLASETGKSQFFEAVILPITYDSKASRSEIKRLELAIQHGQEEKVSYDPLDLALDMYKTIEVEKLLTLEDYAHDANKKTKDISNQIEAIKVVRDFLDFINADKDNYQLIKDAKIFAAVVDTTDKLTKKYPKDGPEFEIAKNQLFTFMLTRIAAASGDVLKDNREFIKTVITSGKQNQFRQSTDEVIENIQDVLETDTIKTVGELHLKLNEDKVKKDLRTYSGEYKTLNQRQNRGKNVESFMDNVTGVVTQLKDLLADNGLSGQLSYDNFSREQKQELRDAMIKIKGLSEDLGEIYSNEL